MFTFIDSLNKVVLRPETKTKLRKTRELLDKEFKEELEREKKEEASAAKEEERIKKRQAENERIAKLSAAEQNKVRRHCRTECASIHYFPQIQEKERKKQMRKAQKSSVRKA